MEQAHREEEHVNKWWKRTDVCCLDTQATCPREVWIIELTWQRYIVCSHLNHKRVCACCVKSVPTTSLKQVVSQCMPVTHRANLPFSLPRNFLRNAGKCCIQYKIQQRCKLQKPLQDSCTKSTKKKSFSKGGNFNRH